MHPSKLSRRSTWLLLMTAFFAGGLSHAQRAAGATYHVDPAAANAADSNPGTDAAPWRTIARAAAAAELRPGDTVLVHSGVYREHVELKVSGVPEKPITFSAAPGARVVVKGSELVRGSWRKVSEHSPRPEPYPNAWSRVWQISLGDEFFTDARFQGAYQDKARRWVSQVFINDNMPLQRIGPDPIYVNKEYLQLATVGRGLEDMTEDSFYFDASDQSLYIKIAGEPAWYSIEVGVRGFVLTADNVHDIVIRGLEFRHNRQPGGQWSMVSLGQCERVIIEDCGVYGSDFCGLSVGRSRHCLVRGCDLSCNGNTGLSLGQCEDCAVESCTLLQNNYRRFHAGWHAGGMKCIPGNVRCTIGHCEVAYNIASDGIWFDCENADIRILSNVSHHNDGAGIFFEINKGGGVIADNLVYGNRGRGIYVSGSQNTWVVHNTVAGNESGIVCMPRGDDWPLENVRILNNLLIRNYVTAESVTRGCDLTIFMGCPEYGPYQRTVTSNHADYNVYANTGWNPTLRHSWNPDNTLTQWQERFHEDLHSSLVPIPCQVTQSQFAMAATDNVLSSIAPLPEDVRSLLPPLRSAGCQRRQWPAANGAPTDGWRQDRDDSYYRKAVETAK
jgi:parallel beta-helix repeat protein